MTRILSFISKIIINLYLISIIIISQCLGDSNYETWNDSEFTTFVNPGSMECFFQIANEQDVLEIEYQVLDSSFGQGNIGRRDLQINFQLISPSGKLVISDFQKEDAMHRHEVLETGEYKICLDNRHSQIARKTVFMEIYIDTQGASPDGPRWGDLDLPPDLAYNDSIEIIKSALNKLREDLNQVQHYQAQRKANEARDRNLQEHNFNTVNFFSVLSIVVMLVVGAVQVIMVRSLFQEKSRLYKIFKALS